MARMPDVEERKTEEMSALGMDLGELGRSVLDAMPDACVIADRQGRVVYVNPAYARVCYREVGQLVGENIFRDNPDAALAQTLRSGEPTLGKKYRVYGGPVEIVAHAFPLYRAGAMVGAVAFFRELSPALELLADLERVQRTARLLQARLEALGRSGPTLESLVGKSPAMVHVLAVARRAALSNAPVLL
ncbi:MAG: PAS domain-containing protein, partial [Clostridia bacterium]|nr:PAS domain-containing protein [Clostridia bacterium]